MYTFDGGTGRRKWNWPTQKKLRKDPIIHQSLLYLRGSVPGHRNGLVRVRASVRAKS